MLRNLSILAAATMLSTAALAANVGESAPAFKGLDAISGKTISNADVKGKTVVMEWNNFGCPFVQKYYNSEAMQKLQAAAVKDGVVWVSVNSSAPGKEGHLKDAAEAKASVKEHHSNASHYLLDHDGAIGHAFGAKATPHMFVIDKDGKLVYQGAIDSVPSPDAKDIAGATNYVSEALAAMKAGKPIATASTRPYGCSVKY
ncbi:MAG: thioredoxin family protein [Rickettsiales bacterium]